MRELWRGGCGRRASSRHVAVLQGQVRVLGAADALPCAPVGRHHRRHPPRLPPAGAPSELAVCCPACPARPLDVNRQLELIVDIDLLDSAEGLPARPVVHNHAQLDADNEKVGAGDLAHCTLLFCCPACWLSLRSAGRLLAAAAASTGAVSACPRAVLFGREAAHGACSCAGLLRLCGDERCAWCMCRQGSTVASAVELSSSC